MGEIDGALVAGYAYRGASGTGHGVRAKAERFDHTNHIGNFGFSRAGVHNDEHCEKRTRLHRGATPSRSTFNAFPLRVTAGKKSLEDGLVDVRDREKGEERRVAPGEIVA